MATPAKRLRQTAPKPPPALSDAAPHAVEVSDKAPCGCVVATIATTGHLPTCPYVAGGQVGNTLVSVIDTQLGAPPAPSVPAFVGVIQEHQMPVVHDNAAYGQDTDDPALGMLGQMFGAAMQAAEADMDGWETIQADIAALRADLATLIDAVRIIGQQQQYMTDTFVQLYQQFGSSMASGNPLAMIQAMLGRGKKGQVPNGG